VTEAEGGGLADDEAPAPLPDHIDLELDVFESGVMVGLLARYISETPPDQRIPAVARVVDRLNRKVSIAWYGGDPDGDEA